MQFKGDFQGFSAIIFSPLSASNLVAAIVDDEDSEGEDMDSLRHSTLNEVGNIVLNAVLGSLTNLMKKRIDYSLPEYSDDKLSSIIKPDQFENGAATLIAKTQFQVRNLEVKGEILLIFTLQSMNYILIQVNKML